MGIRVLLAEDNLLVREGIRNLLSDGDDDIDFVGAVEDMPSLIEACARLEPDVVITDIRMPPTFTDEGIRLANELLDRHPALGVVVLSQHSDPAYVLSLLERGSERRAYLLKSRIHNRAELTAAIRAVGKGDSLIDSKIVERLVRARTAAANSPLGELTPREREVLAEIACGKSNAAIGESLCLTKSAVEKHINTIFLKLGLASADNVSKRVTATLMLLSETGALVGAPERHH